MEEKNLLDSILDLKTMGIEESNHNDKVPDSEYHDIRTLDLVWMMFDIVKPVEYSIILDLFNKLSNKEKLRCIMHLYSEMITPKDKKPSIFNRETIDVFDLDSEKLADEFLDNIDNPSAVDLDFKATAKDKLNFVQLFLDEFCSINEARYIKRNITTK